MIPFDHIETILDDRMSIAVLKEDYMVAAKIRDMKKETVEKINCLRENLKIKNTDEAVNLQKEISNEVEDFLSSLESNPT